MNNVVSLSKDDERLEVASRWILKIDEGMLSAGDKAALGAWLDKDPKHHDVLLEVASVWDKTDALVSLAELFPHEVIDNQSHTVAQPRLWVPWTAIAASLIALVVSITMLLPNSESSFNNEPIMHTQTAEYETAIGEQKTILLPDGSEVLLNTNSQITLTFTSAERVLHLVRGEILIQVAKLPHLPVNSHPAKSTTKSRRKRTAFRANTHSMFSYVKTSFAETYQL